MSSSSPPRGTLFLVVGPSGAGKDSLIAAVQATLAAETGFVFPRRTISRPADGSGESHDTVSEAEFERRRRDGQFLLAWRAHDTLYGIPVAADDALRRGDKVVANVSRTVIGEARQRLAPVRIILVTAPLGVLAHRIRSRSRSGDQVEERLARAAMSMPTGPDVVTVMNDGRLESAVALFLGALRVGSGGGCG